ncbi:MAG TPA: DNA repair protein RecN [Methylophilaceae bacterium]|jgi:DNA repair protein RecN (Recombination protein N)
MLQALTIRDFVIVDRLDLEFSPGFTVLTGETGAGKSILIDALSLTLGARSEGGVTRNGCERAEIVASFDISGREPLQELLREYELQAEDNVLMLRRIIYADGRSRAFVNGMPANIQQLREIGEHLVDIYSQHAHHSLLKPQYQRQVLDSYAGLTELAVEVAQSYRAWHALHVKRLEMERNAQAHADELAQLRDQVRELEQLELAAEEWDTLQAEHHRLLHAASLLEGSEACRALLSDSEYAVIAQLSAIQHRLQGLVEYDAGLQEVLDMVDSAVVQLEESDRFLNRYLQRDELDPERLHEIEQRVQAIHAASRKYRVRPEELPDLLQTARSRMAELEGLGDDEALRRREDEARIRYDELAGKLSAGRRQAAERLGREITERMQTLALAGGSFAVALEAHEPSANGLEQVEFLVAGHAGVAPRPLSKVASGGELSRISLAIRVVTAQQGDIPTMIFDEVDVGIGGGVAEIVGQLLKELGRRRQVLVITHLPQVAAQGAAHLRVSKSVVDGQTLSRIEVLGRDERIDEVARMLGGVEITATTRQHASEMLGY